MCTIRTGVYLCARDRTGSLMLAGASLAADEQSPTSVAGDIAKTTAPAAPELPGYFSGVSPDKNKPTWPDPTGGNAGACATPAGDGKGDVPAKQTTADLYDRIAHNLFSINMVWALIAGFLVMFMQAGFAMVETGLCRAKNSAHTMSMNLMIYAFGCISFWAYGFALGWGKLGQRAGRARLVFVAWPGHGRTQQRLGAGRRHGRGPRAPSPARSPMDDRTEGILSQRG